MSEKSFGLPTPDGLAAAAATLSVKSKYLQDNKDMCGAFWYFYDLLAREVEKRKEQTIWVAEERERERQRQEELDGITPMKDEVREALLAAGETRAAWAMGRAFWYHGLRCHPREATDEELRAMPGIGPIFLGKIRKVFPYQP